MRDQGVMGEMPGRRGKRPSRAPAVGCFGQLHLNENYAGTERQHPATHISEWDRLTDRFAAIDYGDGKAAPKKAPRTS